MSSSYLPVFPNLTFKTVFLASLLCNRPESEALKIVAAFAVTSTSFFNSSFQANVVSRMEIDDKTIKLVNLFLLTSTTTGNKLSTIQMTPVLTLKNFSHPDSLINTLKNSTYFCRSLKQLTVRNHNAGRLLRALENLVALEVLYFSVVDYMSDESEQRLSVISRLPSLIQLKFGVIRDVDVEDIRFFGFLGGLANNKGFRKLSIGTDIFVPGGNFKLNFKRLCKKNLLTHLSLNRYFANENLEVLKDAKLTNLRSLKLRGGWCIGFGKVVDAIIASSTSLTVLHVDEISDDVLVKCAEHLSKLVELRVNYSLVNGSFLREKGSCFARLEILDVSCSRLSDDHLEDGFKYLTSLRELNVFDNRHFSGTESLQYLTAATSLEELKLGKINGASLKAVGQLMQLSWLHVNDVGDDVKSEDVMHIKSLVNLRNLTLYVSSRVINDGIFKIAESLRRLEYIKLAYNKRGKWNSPTFSGDQVTYLLEKCWPMVRYAVFEYEDPDTAMPYLRQRFPHVDFGERAEAAARKHGTIVSSPKNVPARRQRSP